MVIRKSVYFYFLLTTIFFMVIVSCSIERKFAKEFITNDSTRTALFIPPDYIFKSSLKSWEIDSAEQLSEWELDSALYDNSLFLQYVSDSVFLDYYTSNYISELEELGFRVYPDDSLLNFLSGQQDAFIFQLAQLEMEEYVMPFEESAQFGEYIYSEEIDLNALSVNSWFEISRVNEEEDKAMFFSSHYLTDDMEGSFKYYYSTGIVEFQYEIDTMMVDQIYRLGALGGYLYAGYTFDFLLNKYIDKRMYEEGYNRSTIYYHFDRKRRLVTPAKEDERFIPMD